MPLPAAIKNQSKTMQDRWTRLMPNDLPRYVHCYDSPDTIDRYTVVFTGNYAGRKGCDYLGMSGAPFHPQGVGQHGWNQDVIDRPSYGHLGKKVHFSALPEDCQVLVLRDYLVHWGFFKGDGSESDSGDLVAASNLARQLVGARIQAQNAVPV